MKSISVFTAMSLVGCGLVAVLPAAPAAAQNWQEITCESWNYREAVCPIPGAVRVQLLRVRGGQCIEGQSWYQDNRSLHVRGGCRATFRIDANNGYGLGGYDSAWNNGGFGGINAVQRLRCESWNYRDQVCRVPGGAIRGARITRVIAGDCRDGATWRWDRRAVHVRNGCRADFEVVLAAGGWAGGWAGGNPNRPIVSLTCESWNYRAARCPIPRGRQVQLLRVLGGNCQEGRTWGRRAGTLWVNGGCRATFQVF